MSAELELTEALKLIRQENARLQAENARLREVLATYPERQHHVASVLAEMRTLLWQLVGVGGSVRRRARDGDDALNGDTTLGTGIPPMPDEQWWPRDSGPTLTVHPDDEPTQVEIPE